MIWEKAQEHETRLGFNVLRAKGTILLHCLIKFINWIRCLLSIQTAIDFISEGILGDAVWVMRVGVRWWKNMKNRKVYGVFCCSIVLPYGFYSSCVVRAWWERRMRGRRALQSMSHSSNLNSYRLRTSHFFWDRARGYWKSISYPILKHYQTLWKCVRCFIKQDWQWATNLRCSESRKGFSVL